MMKFSVLGVCFFLFGLSVTFGQAFNYNWHCVNLDKYKVVDSAYLKCSYKVTYLTYDDHPDFKSYDLQVLLIGKKMSKYYSQYAVDYNMKYTELARKTKRDISMPSNPNPGAWTYELFKNYPAGGKESMADVGSMLYRNFLYEEDTPVLKWTIGTERDTVLSYPCTKATTSFRGRDYIAWFAPDIPVNNGPWKFGGLPGLILKIKDTKDNFIFECNGLEYLKKKEPVKYYLLEYTKVTREGLDKWYRRFNADYVGYIIRETGLSMFSHGKRITKSEGELPYNPIELE